MHSKYLFALVQPFDQLSQDDVARILKSTQWQKLQEEILQIKMTRVMDRKKKQHWKDIITPGIKGNELVNLLESFRLVTFGDLVTFLGRPYSKCTDKEKYLLRILVERMKDRGFVCASYDLRFINEEWFLLEWLHGYDELNGLIKNILRNSKITTIAGIREMSKEKLHGIPKFGDVSFKATIEWLESNGIYLQ